MYQLNSRAVVVTQVYGDLINNFVVFQGNLTGRQQGNSIAFKMINLIIVMVDRR